MLTNPPFTRQPGSPPLHFRDWTPEGLAQAQRMRDAYAKLFEPTAAPQEAPPESSPPANR